MASILVFELHLKLSNHIEPVLWSEIDACAALKSLKTEERENIKLTLKFEKMGKISSISRTSSNKPQTLPELNPRR